MGIKKWGDERMTRREAGIVSLFLALPIFVIGCLTILALIIAVIPREQTRQLRLRLAKLVMWQWIKSMKVSRIAHDWLWSEGNGHTYDYSKVG